MSEGSKSVDESEAHSRLSRVVVTLPLSDKSEKSALIVPPQRNENFRGRGRVRGGCLFACGGRGQGRGYANFQPCQNCGLTNHATEFCWGVIGKPTSYRANQASTSEDKNHGEMFSQLQEDLEKLQKCMQAMASNHSPSTAHLADSGNVCLHTSASHPWVIDSGASDHMTGKEEIFQSLHRSTSSSCVTLANGSKSQILGSGIVRPCKDITLS